MSIDSKMFELGKCIADLDWAIGIRASEEELAGHDSEFVAGYNHVMDLESAWARGHEDRENQLDYRLEVIDELSEAAAQKYWDGWESI